MGVHWSDSVHSVAQTSEMNHRVLSYLTLPAICGNLRILPTGLEIFASKPVTTKRTSPEETIRFNHRSHGLHRIRNL